MKQDFGKRDYHAPRCKKEDEDQECTHRKSRMCFMNDEYPDMQFPRKDHVAIWNQFAQPAQYKLETSKEQTLCLMERDDDEEMDTRFDEELLNP
ncbi:hypothetical protein FDP41_008007 [Naegleria fowleri]|uniref:Uncharacterized protein n=1 Tax=Naegleria fowleri TaxID=5763 RepID=A0A6A5CAR1_NAEFO|nr:uncharacterized protein FDP41_008007 [Naegleria fowleri]KAF0984092.1 hypothetical protein FDP41_008007 [Naegleria fowleri]CAG4713242.1 unnamed protein product [Naegleria fowleri]